MVPFVSSDPKAARVAALVRSGGISIRGETKLPDLPTEPPPPSSLVDLFRMHADSPLKRGICLAAGFGVLAFLLKPSIFFDKAGGLKRWSLLAPGEADTTDVPLILGVVLAGVVGAYLV